MAFAKVLAVGAVIGCAAVVAAPVAAQASTTAPAPTKSTISGWGHNLSGGIPVGIKGSTMTRNLAIKPGGIRTIEVNDYTCHTLPSGKYVCSAKVIETLHTNAQGQVSLTLPVHKNVDSYAIYVQATGTAAAAETQYWGVYRA